MSVHKFVKGAQVVCTRSREGFDRIAFGVVISATRYTAKVRYCKSKLTDQGSVGVFDELVDRVVDLHWNAQLRSMSACMIDAAKQAIFTCQLYDETAVYDTNVYF